jgi:uncharacterized membrane protein
MLEWTQWIRLLHLVTAMLMLAGWIGRQLTRAQAARATDIRVFAAFVQLGGRFENLLVIPGSLLVFVFGVAIAWLRGWPLFGFLQGASSNWLLVSLLLYLAVYPLVILIFLPRGKIFGKALEDAVMRGQITPALTAAFHDPQVRWAHKVEALLIIAVVYLMIMKPF